MAEEEKKEDEATEDKSEATEENGAEGDQQPAKKSKKKIIIIAAAAVVLLIAIGAGLFFSGILGGDAKPEEGAQQQETKKDSHDKKDGAAESGNILDNQPFFLELEPFMVNLTKIGGYQSFLKMTISIEVVGSSDLEKVKEKMPLIRDSLQVYLRELRADDLQGSAGAFKLREELHLRINKILYPIKVKKVLFKDLLVQ